MPVLFASDRLSRDFAPADLVVGMATHGCVGSATPAHRARRDRISVFRTGRSGDQRGAGEPALSAGRFDLRRGELVWRRTILRHEPAKAGPAGGGMHASVSADDD